MTQDIKINFLEDSANDLAFSFGTPSTKVDGLEKIALQWVKALLTDIGSDLYDPAYGSSFGSLLSANAGTGVRDLRSQISFALDQATESIVRLQDDDLELDDIERLDDHEILSITTGATSVSVVLELRNVAGENILLRVSNG